jgi:hypothetical protein
LFKNKVAKLLAFKDSVVGTKCTIFLSLSTNTKIGSWPSAVVGSFTMRSIDTLSHLLPEIERGYR